jgi:hypothetical protein
MSWFSTPLALSFLSEIMDRDCCSEIISLIYPESVVSGLKFLLKSLALMAFTGGDRGGALYEKQPNYELA